MVAVMEREHVDIGADNNLNTGKIINPLDQKVFASKPSEESPGDSAEAIEIIHPLDKEVLNLRNGYIPSWSKVVGEFGLQKLPRGKKKLFRSYYRAQSLYAQRRKIKGHDLMQSLLKKSEFRVLEKECANDLERIANMVRKGR